MFSRHYRADIHVNSQRETRTAITHKFKDPHTFKPDRIPAAIRGSGYEVLTLTKKLFVLESRI